MSKVETTAQIQRRWKREGRTFRAADVVAEMQRQGREALRAREDAILAADPDSEVAAQIRDHRAAGNYTTQG